VCSKLKMKRNLVVFRLLGLFFLLAGCQLSYTVDHQGNITPETVILIQTPQITPSIVSTIFTKTQESLTPTATPVVIITPEFTPSAIPTIATLPPKPEHGDSFSPSISGNGQVVAFTSSAGDLNTKPLAQCRYPDGQSFNCTNVFVYDHQTGTINLISAAISGDSGNGHSRQPDISADGQWVVFSSEASNLTPYKANRDWGVFLYNLQNQSLSLVSPSGTNPTISDDGRYIAFNALTDQWHVFIHDRQTEQTIRVSSAIGGGPADGNSLSPQISGDGQWVAFWSWAGNLVADDGERCQQSEMNYSCGDLFLYNRELGELKRIAVGEAYGLGMGDFSLSLSDDGRWLAFDNTVYDRESEQTTPLCGIEDDSCFGGTLSGDGQWVVFSNGAEIFVFNRMTGESVLVSVNSDGIAGNGEVVDILPSFAGGSFEPGFDISYNGRWVTFSSTADNLSLVDTAICSDTFFAPHNCYDIYLYDRQEHESIWVSEGITHPDN
ncbi:MAG: PD40 domain-containing protein, partial [Anaerolineae bacterium]|nr:PD40 domain-containing protein [Anaerolineae bacterium]